MAMSEDDRKEMLELISDAMALGIGKFRSAAEEEEAKNGVTKPPADPPKETKSDDGFSLAGFILGR